MRRLAAALDCGGHAAAGLSSVTKLAIDRLAANADAEACARFMSETDPWRTLGRTYEDCLAVLSNPGRETWIARDGGTPAGFIILNMQGAFVGYIQTICVAPEYRSRGVGSRLIEFAEERIFRDVPNVFLCVSSFNTRARALYERLGYQVVGTLTDYLVRGHDEILMRKTRGPILDA